MRHVFTALPVLAAGFVWASCAPAHAHEVEHPVFPISPSAQEVERLQTQVEHVMAMSQEDINDWIVAKSSFQVVACPNCEWPGGRRDRRDRFRWTPDDPDRITCTHCDIVHPHPDYPLEQVYRFPDPTGQVQEYPHWEGPDGYMYFIPAKIDNHKKRHMESMAVRLAILYAGTGDDDYARQAARILNRLADVYPHYNVQASRGPALGAGRPGHPILIDVEILDSPDGIQPVPGLANEMDPPGYSAPSHYPYWSNRRGDGWNTWLYSEIPTALAYAYDRVAASAAVDEVSEELGRDVRANIRDFFRATANFTRSYPVYTGNMAPFTVSGLAVVGRVIGEPEFVHDALRRIEPILHESFFADGNFSEAAPSYHHQTSWGLRRAVEGSLAGYSDPPGYINPIDGKRLDNLDARKKVPFLYETIRALENMRLPHGAYVTIDDTWSPTTQGRPLGAVPDEPIPTHLHWAMGHAIIGSGVGKTGVQAHLNSSGGYGHDHADMLNLIVFGQGKELVSDIGYSHTVLANYTRGSLAHNVVLVDERDQRRSGRTPPSDGSLISWGEAGDLLTYCEVSGPGAYPELCSEYRRGLAVVSLPGGGAYVVDVFRVAGGSKHDWALHGSADEDQALRTDLPVEDYGENLLPEGVAFHEWANQYQSNVIRGRNNSYGVFRDVTAGSAEQNFFVEFVCEDGIGVRTSLLGLLDTTALFGRLPSVRRAQEDSARVYDYWMPAMLLRREGADLASTFAAVHEPFDGEPVLVAVERLELAAAPEGAVGIACHGNGFTDYHLLGPSPDSGVEAAEAPLSSTGRYAFVRVVAGEVSEMALVDGSRVAFEEWELTLPPSPSGEVVAVRIAEKGDAQNALVVTPPVAPETVTPGGRIVVEFGNGMTYALAIESVAGDGERSLITLRHRPGFRLADDGETVVMTHHPLMEIPGRPTWRLPNVVRLRGAD